MKKTILISVQILLMLISGTLWSQTRQLTPNGMYDEVSDGLGNKYNLVDLSTFSAKPIGSGNTVQAVPTATCNAGKFKLFFAPGSIFTQTAQMQTIACQVFSDISSLIDSNIPSNSVNIYCGNLSAGSGFNAAVTPYYIYPNTPAIPNQGIIQSLVEKALIMGVDPYSTLPIAAFYSANTFYHGSLSVNTSTAINWNLATNTLTINNNEIDFYGIILHEAMHLLGFATLISANGFSTLGQNNNYYGRYDQFLKDAAGNPLLGSLTSSLCGNNVTYTAALSAIASSTNVCYIDVTNCANAARYSSPSTNTPIAVFTPSCFMSGSSLQHFEDMCSSPGFTTACTGTTTPANWNNLYYVMSNLNDPGSCYVKRYLKEEEYKVLCDIGYSVTGTFTSSALLSGTNTSHTYTTGACSPSMTIIGNDDGYVGNVFTYTSNTTSAVISFSTLLANDTPSASLGVSCLELVYNNATLTAGGSNFTVTAPLGAGLILLKYLPKNSVNQFGNITYVYVYFLTAGCNSPNACNMVQNGGYESLSGGNPPCGPINTSLGGNPIYLSCWDVYEQNLPILFTASCTSLGNIYNLGVNTLSTTPVVSSFNGAAGNINAVCFQGTQTFCSSMKNSLSSPLIPGQPYQLSLWMQNHSSTQPGYTINPNGYAAVFSIASLPQFAMTPTLNFPTGLNVLTQFTVPAGNSWSQFTNTFVFSSTLSPHSALVVGLSYVNSASITVGNNIYETFKCFVDEISLVALPSPTFSIPTPTMCGVASFTDLGQYTGTVSGTFSGTAVTYTNGQYDFNYPPTLGAGNYPIAFTYSISGGCQHTIYQQVTSIGACCNSTTIPQFTATTISTSTLLPGPIRFSSDFTIQPGVTLSLYSDEYIFESTARIVVAANASLSLNGSHLYSCGGDLWQGILVKDGGYVHSNSYNSKDCLIEDAVTAIDAPSQATTTLSTILSLANTTFNKNYTDINFANYPCASNSYSDAITLNNCVFTCRDFTFNATSWPSVSTSSNGLRYSANTSTVLGAPYNLNSATIVNLKNPYNSVKSHVAIQLTDVGTTTGTMYPLSFNGLNLSPSGGANFNLFDAHENFISANNSNVSINNSAFQNTQTYTLLSTPTVAAISHSNNSVSNFELDLSAPSPSVGNRFYDCHYAVKAKNSFNFKIENASIRSTQSTAVNSPTYYGLSINTNQAGDYSIKTNEVTNVRDGVAISFAPAPTMAPDLPFYAGTPPVYIYATYIRTITINSNTISPYISPSFTSSSNYVKNAINLDSPSLTYVWSSCSCNSITINNNIVYHAFNGIKLSGLNSYTLTCRNTGTPKVIAGNIITLAEDNTWSDKQKGIDFTWSTSLPVAQGQKIQTIEGNTLTVAGGTVAQNNTNIILYYGNNNGALSPASGSLYPTPHILCNDLSNAYQGFVFDGTNKPASWRGNKMEDLQIAMTLSNTGQIGQQGDAGNPVDNEWNGSWTTHTQTIVDNSTGASSVLFVQNTSINLPTINAGPVFQNYNTGGYINISTSGSYTCGNNNYTLMNSPLPNPPDYPTDELLYIANTFSYRYLAINDSMKNVATDLSTFYTSLSGSSIDEFTQVELKLNEGDFSAAGSILSGIDQSGFNQVETNYFSFYTLYKKYLEGSVPLSSTDIETLIDLAGLCAGTNGSAVYQARSLFQLVTNQVYNGSDGCSGGARPSNNLVPEQTKDLLLKTWDVDLYPNPATNQITIISKVESESLMISIKDLTGRSILNQNLKTIGFIANLDLDLINGAYLITLSNVNNEKITKKLLIAK